MQCARDHALAAQIDQVDGASITAFSAQGKAILLWSTFDDQGNGITIEHAGPEMRAGAVVSRLVLHLSGAFAIMITSPHNSAQAPHPSDCAAYILDYGNSRVFPLHIPGASCAAWVPAGGDAKGSSTQLQAVVGTRTGEFHWVRFTRNSAGSAKSQHLFTLPESSLIPSVGLTTSKASSKSAGHIVSALSIHTLLDEPDQLLILAATDEPAYLYQFKGGSSPREVFDAAKSAAVHTCLRPGGLSRAGTQLRVHTPNSRELSQSLLAVTAPLGNQVTLSDSRGRALPQSAAMSTSEGLLYGSLDLSAEFQVHDRGYIRGAVVLPYPSISCSVGDRFGPHDQPDAPPGTTASAAAVLGGLGGPTVTPLDFQLTAFRIVYFFTSSVIVINRVSFEVVFVWHNDHVASDSSRQPKAVGQIVAAASSAPPSTGVDFATDRGVLRVSVSNENAGLWRIILNQAIEAGTMALFDKALTLAPVRKPVTLHFPVL